MLGSVALAPEVLPGAAAWLESLCGVLASFELEPVFCEMGSANSVIAAHSMKTAELLNPRRIHSLAKVWTLLALCKRIKQPLVPYQSNLRLMK